MQPQDYPLIFIVEDNSIYNKLIANHLMSNKFKRIECFISGEECLKNLYKKPDIVIQDYLMNEVIGNNILMESKKSNLNTEFVFLSGLDNFSKEKNQNTKLIDLSGSDKIDDSADTIKYGPHDYVVKDLAALEKLVGKIGKMQQVSLHKKQTKVSLSLFFNVFALLFVSFVNLVKIFPKTFSF
ncbi:MAG: response regulator [Bacteroidia bacterium]|nr:response regulator [Bacteroidia bacterium]